MAVVSILKVDSYDPALLDQAVARQFEMLGIEGDLKPGMKVLIKPNLLTGRRPELCVTTHPALIRAVAGWLKQRGVEHITLADSPGGPYRAQLLSAIYAACQLTDLEPLLTLNLNTEAQLVPAAPGGTHAEFPIIKPILQADYIINMAKMKTHGMTTVSLGIKNLFGTIPGLTKPRLHYENPSLDGFSKMLVSLAETVKPNLTVIDAIDAMEGNGPGGGDPRHAGLLLASRDVFAQDCVAANLMGIAPESVDMIRIAMERGLIEPERIQLVGDEVAPCEPAFKLPTSRSRVDFTSHLPGFLRPLAQRVLDKRIKALPVVREDKCIGCGKCAESCPQGIIQIQDKKARIDRRRCISCLCCQEMCPVKAIDAEQKFKWRKPKRAR